MTFLEQYKVVFDIEGNVKNCGREACRELIRRADEIDSGVSHGDLDTGYMDIVAIQRLYNAVKE